MLITPIWSFADVVFPVGDLPEIKPVENEMVFLIDHHGVRHDFAAVNLHMFTGHAAQSQRLVPVAAGTEIERLAVFPPADPDGVTRSCLIQRLPDGAAWRILPAVSCRTGFHIQIPGRGSLREC